MSEMTLSEAAAEASKFGNTIRAFSKLQDVVDTLTSQQQLAKERQAQLDKLLADVVAAKKKAAFAESQASDAKLRADALIAEATEKAQSVLDAAKADAAKVKDESDEAAAAALTALEEVKAAADVEAKRRDAAKVEADEHEKRVTDAKADARARFG